MKKLQKLFAMTAVLSMMASPALYSQETYYDNNCNNNNDCSAYCDSGCASNMTALLPIGALVVAGVLIATTHRHHHGSSSSCSSTSHAHFSSCSGSGSGSSSSCSCD